MNATKNVLAAALVLAGALALAACGSDGSDATADDTAAKATWFQVRPVLSQKAAAASDCATQAVVPPNDQAATAVCAVDGEVVYSLGPAAIDENAVDSVGNTDSLLQLGLTPPAKATFATLTGALADEAKPRNGFAVLVDGAVVDAPVVKKQVTDGMLLVTIDDESTIEPIMLRFS